MKIGEIVNESFADYGNEWVHYTNHPMLTISPPSEQFHQDPSGIYFFPAKITPKADMWRTRKYKFTAQLKPNVRVLDIPNITDQQIEQMVRAAGVEEQFRAYITQYPPENPLRKFKMAWEKMRGWFAYESGKVRQYSSFNAVLRRLGWDAIFDDTGSIHSGEPEQLLVLNPRILTNVRMEQASGGGFAAMQKVYQDIKSIAQKYGILEVTPIRRPTKNAYYSDRDNIMMATIQVTNPQDKNNNASIYIYIQKKSPDKVVADKRYSSPNSGYGVATYSISTGQYDEWNNLERFDKSLAQTFEHPSPVAETKKLPGPKVVGSGKDFRQNAGVNRSPKQPGRLAGSGRPMKVRPGFVGSG